MNREHLAIPFVNSETLVNNKKLKLGILLESYEVPTWAYNALKRIVNSDYAEFSLIIFTECTNISKSQLHTFWLNKDKIGYYLFNKIDEKLFQGEPDAFIPKNILNILLGVPTIKLIPIQKGDSDNFEASGIERIKEYKLDILIRMGSGPLPGDVLTISKYGIWSYYHGDNRTNRGGPPGFWEVVEGGSETGAILQMFTDNLEYGKVIYRSWFSTYQFSPARNRGYCYWASGTFLARQIELLHRLGEEDFLAQVDRYNGDCEYYDHRYYQVPSNISALGLIIKLVLRNLFEIYQRKFYLDTWYLMYDFNKKKSTSFSKFKTIIPPKDRFWADPNIIQAAGKYYVFVEEYFYKSKKGHISVIEMDEEGNYEDPVRVLQKDYHLSYPFVFEWNGKCFLVPESAANRTIDLYECIEFPHKWKVKMTLMENILAVDTTMFYYYGKWWLFTGIAENAGAFPQVELFLFYSDELFTNEWKGHPMNPIVSDVKKARPAGRLFTRDGKIFRPSQDCSKRYGYGFDLNEVLLLSETKYFEKKVVSVRPNWDKKIKGTHTFAREGQLTIIDAFMRRRRLF